MSNYTSSLPSSGQESRTRLHPSRKQSFIDGTEPDHDQRDSLRVSEKKSSPGYKPLAAVFIISRALCADSSVSRFSVLTVSANGAGEHVGS